ncbi:MAG TPA: hypothetical protein VKI65_07725 [Gemmataceae bacterium]|nr:hypothetical protein [Gemmataceae bacterium]
MGRHENQFRRLARNLALDIEEFSATVAESVHADDDPSLTQSGKFRGHRVYGAAIVGVREMPAEHRHSVRQIRGARIAIHAMLDGLTIDGLERAYDVIR